ncbi:hypothetical protein AB0J35_00470 [Nonomuraea angiospora]
MPERALGGVLVRQAVIAALPICVVAARPLLRDTLRLERLRA